MQTVIVGALLIASLCLMLFDPFPYPAIDLTLRFLTGAAIGALFIMGEFWINSAAPDQHRGLILGIYGSFLAAGFAAGPAILDLVGTSNPTALHIGAGVFIAALLPVVLMTKGAPDLEGGTGANVMSFLVSAPIATIAGLLFGMIEPSGLNLLPVYGLGIGLPLSEATALVSAMALGNMLQIPLGILADRIDRRVMLLICGLMGGILTLCLPALSASPWALLIGIFSGAAWHPASIPWDSRCSAPAFAGLISPMRMRLLSFFTASGCLSARRLSARRWMPCRPTDFLEPFGHFHRLCGIGRIPIGAGAQRIKAYLPCLFLDKAVPLAMGSPDKGRKRVPRLTGPYDFTQM